MPIVHTIHKDKFILQYISSEANVAILQKVEILAVLADKLLHRSTTTRRKIFIEYDQGFNTSLTLGYGSVSYSPEKDAQNGWVQDSGIVISIQGRSFSILKTLKLLSAVQNNTSIEYLLTKNEASVRFGHLVKTVPDSKIDSITSSIDTLVNSIIKVKQEQVYLPYPNHMNYPRYFYQNDKFLIVSGDTVEQTLLDLVHVINLDHPADYLVFLNDSTFYYKRWPKQLKGPFTINGFKNLGPLKYECLVEDSISSFTKITIKMTFGYSDYVTKALFIPSQNRVISRYDTLENYYLSKVGASESSISKLEPPTDIKTLILYAIIILLAISNIYLLVRRKIKHTATNNT